MTYFLDENHGWFDAAGTRAVHSRTIFTEGFATWEQAEERMKDQLRYAARQGYVHSYVHDPMESSGAYYRKIDPENI